MLQLRTLRLMTILFATLNTILLLYIFHPYKHAFIPNESYRFIRPLKNIYTGLRLPKVILARTPTDRETDNFYEQEYLKIIKKYAMKGITHQTIDRPTCNVKLMRRPWFMKCGKIRPKAFDGNGSAILWPEQDAGDRIIQQLMYVPSNYLNGPNGGNSVHRLNNKSIKKILLYFGAKEWNDLPLGREVFFRDKCPVHTCSIVTARKHFKTSDAILFKNRVIQSSIKRTSNQVWILYLLESPMNMPSFNKMKDVINWTATYRQDSDIVIPYEKYVNYKFNSRYSLGAETTNLGKPENFASGKTHLVAAFISNCYAKNRRIQYIYMLSHYIQVDIYGDCGTMFCSRNRNSECMNKLDTDYKFYLAFENSNCKDYITEKFFVNGLSHNVVPIVMGAKNEDYSRVAPPHSYIHVDDFASPEELAKHLKILDANDTLYNEYFKWKGTGEFINTYFWCRLCALLHAPHKHKSYSDIREWWSKPGTCDANYKPMMF